ncbi:MAG: glutamine--fructose-6-phosphate transaminase (isomerizing) [Firmicutes bacterium]|nr:glutamine--fructose-6-phosphate transaminase (isomerizing) [Bacillota bacterium]
MCGIVGYVGDGSALPFILDGLKKLEYRGYDSAGVAVLDKDHIEVLKKVGRLSNLVAALDGFNDSDGLGIGHTRWATHGRPSDQNAHPHSDCTGDFVVVHNGIIENFGTLKDYLVARGHRFTSETDTEVVAHLIEDVYEGDLSEAVRQAVSRLKGSFALGVISKREPGKIIAVRKDSPLIVGLGEGENYIASDIPAILGKTRRAYILEDGEMAILTRDSVTIKDTGGHLRNKEVFNIKWDAVAAERGGYQHFMLKEIHETPRAVRDTLSGRVADDGSRVVLDELGLPYELVTGVRRVFVVACGTAYHAGLTGKYLIEKMARIPVEADLASEFRYRETLMGPGDMMIVVSQSGETADTLAALRVAKRKGVPVLAICNVLGSSISREADYVLHTWAGPEIAVASTKAYVTQCAALALLATYLAQERRLVDEIERRRFISEIRALPDRVAAVLRLEDQVARIASDWAHVNDMFFIGRGLDYSIAMEGQLKIKEIAYIHAEAYAAGELKHGTLALIVEGVPVIALATQPHVMEKMLSNITEVKAREATVIGVVPEGSHEMADIRRQCDVLLEIPSIDPLLMPAVEVVPLQLLAYYAAVARGCDVDKPRNLAKSVTVE